MTDDASLSGQSIKLVVGPEPSTVLEVHENLICTSSDFFKRLRTGEWKEANERTTKFEEDNPNVFQLYLHWLYRGTLPIRNDAPGRIGNAEYECLAEAYVLGDKLQDGDFQDVIVDTIVDKCSSKASDGRSWFPVGPAIQHVYDHTVESSKVRRLLVDLYVSHGSGNWLRDWEKSSDIPGDFLFEIATNLLDKRKNNPTIKSSLCEYHQHGPDPLLCYRTRSTD